jgi:hypothetical protein
MEKLEIKEATNQAPPFYKGRKWMIPQSCFILISLGKTYSPEEIAELKTKINTWSKRRDRYMVDITLSKTYGPEILIFNETLLDKRAERKLPKALDCSKSTA